MTTFKDLVDECMIVLAGYTQRQDQATFLTADMTADALTFVVQDGTTLSRGMVEIGDELMWVDSFDKTTSTASVAPYGRGFRATTKTSHKAGDRVAIAPSFPRSVVIRSINNAIDGVYPDLFAVGYSEFPFVAVRTTYELPAEAIDPQQVTWRTIGPSKEWLPIRNYRMDRMAAVSQYPTGKTISVYDAIIPGRPIHVTYTKKPSPLEFMTDDFCDTGLPDSVKEVVVLGAAYRAAAYLDLGRIPAQSAEADAMQQNDPIGSGASASRLLFQLYKERLSIEVRRQQEQFPARIRITR